MLLKRVGGRQLGRRPCAPSLPPSPTHASTHPVLQPPSRCCSFRPGTSTWNTDEPDAPGTAPAGPSAGKKVRPAGLARADAAACAVLACTCGAPGGAAAGLRRSSTADGAEVEGPLRRAAEQPAFPPPPPPLHGRTQENLSAGRKVPPPYSIKTEESFQTTGKWSFLLGLSCFDCDVRVLAFGGSCPAPGSSPLPVRTPAAPLPPRPPPPPAPRVPSTTCCLVRLCAGAASRAFTSTAMAPVLKNERTMRVIQLQPTAKG